MRERSGWGGDRSGLQAARTKREHGWLDVPCASPDVVDVAHSGSVGSWGWLFMVYPASDRAVILSLHQSRPATPAPQRDGPLASVIGFGGSVRTSGSM